jgi:hypothetical protein
MTTSDPESEQPRSKRILRFSLAGLLFAVLCAAGVLVGARVGQQRLRLSPDPLQMTVAQRSSQAIPGLRGLAHLALDDITDDAVILRIQDNLGSDLIAPAKVRERDVVSFQLRGQTFYIRVARLVNNLIGQDFGVLDVSTTQPSP